MYLVDTNIISSGAPTKAVAPAPLLAWMDAASSGLFLSVVTAAEVAAGIAKAEREGATTKSRKLREWWTAVEHLYGDRILPIDHKVAPAIGQMLDKARSIGQAPGWADLAIAGTALTHGLTILTRNLRHFQPLGISCLDPFADLPPLP
jgi:predicted nucleic acid-binding protein